MEQAIKFPFRIQKFDKINNGGSAYVNYNYLKNTKTEINFVLAKRR